MTEKSRSSHSLIAVITVAVLLRLLCAGAAFVHNGTSDSFYASDSQSYINGAKALVYAGRYTVSPEDPTPELLRTPGYPVFLIPAVLSGRLEAVVIVMQALVGGISTYLVYCIGLCLFSSPRVGALGALLYAFEPLSAIYCGLIMSETLFTCLFLAFVHSLLKFFRDGRRGDLLLTALFLVGAVFVRPVLYYFIPLAAVGIFWRATALNRGLAPAIAYAAAFALVCGAPVALWQVRNSIETGFSGFSAVHVINLYWCVRTRILAEPAGKTVQQTQVEMQRESEAADRVPGSSPRGELKASLEKQRKEAIDAILAAPGTFLRVYIEGQVKFWAAPGGGDLLFFFAGDTAAERIRFAVDADAAIAGKGIIGRQLVYMKLYPALFWSGVFCGLVLLFYLTFFVAGVSVASRDGNRAALVVFALLMYFPLTFFDTGNPARFRLPVMPLVAVFAGYGLTEGLRRFVPRMSAAREHDSSASV